MARLGPAVAAWMRHTVPWSNTRQAWQERLGVLSVFVAVLAGIFLIRDFAPAWQVLFWGLVLATAALLLRRGWLKLFGPVLFFDLLCLARRLRYFIARTSYAAFLLFIVVWTWFAWSVGGQFDASRIDVVASFANTIFEVFMSVQFFLVTLLTPVYTASAVADEKEHRTLEFLLATDLRNREIVLSKLLARFLNIGMLVLAGLPILALMQFLGGVDPGLVLAGYAATLATMASLACLGTLFSVLLRKGRDAILVTYLCVFAYFIGWAMQLAIPATWLSFPSPASPITLGDVLNWYNAGNILHAIRSIGYLSWQSGASVGDALPEALGAYLLFHGLLASICIVWAVLRLRAVAMKETYGKAQKVRLGVRLFGRPSVGARPMVWKEVFAEPGLRLHWLGRIIVCLLVLASFVPLIIFFDEFFRTYGNSYSMLADAMNIWGRVVGAMVGSLLLLGVAVRAAGGITGERDRQTLDSLLTSPLDSNAILLGKWLGSVLSIRRGWLWLGAIYGLTFVSGGVNFIGLMLVIAAWFIFAAFVAMLGLWATTTCRTTLRATVWTLLATATAFGGHWLLWLCCAPLAWMGSGSSGEFFGHVAEFQLFALTPPVTLGQLAFRAEELVASHGSWSPVEHTAMAVIGLVLWLIFTFALWGVVSANLQRVLLRTQTLRPQSVSRRSRRLPQPKRMDEGILTVEEVVDEEDSRFKSE